MLRQNLEAELSEVSFAYRRGKPWLGALRSAEQCRDQGLRWMVRGDIASYFDTISHQRLRGQLTRLVGDPAAVDIIMQRVAAPVLTDNWLNIPQAGMPQEVPISPALANHYLAGLDEHVDGQHGRLVRYTDDLTMFCSDEDAAQAARWGVEQGLSRLDLTLNTHKSYVSSFDRGFSFLGWVFSATRGTRSHRPRPAGPIRCRWAA